MKHASIGGELSYLQRAPEPSDVIWENMNSTRSSILKKKIAVYLIVLMFLGIIFMFVLSLAQQVNMMLSVFPMDARCDVISETYHNRLQQCAIDDYNNLKQWENIFDPK